MGFAWQEAQAFLELEQSRGSLFISHPTPNYITSPGVDI